MQNFLGNLLVLRSSVKKALLAEAHKTGKDATLIVETAIASKGKASVMCRLEYYGNQELVELWDIYIDIGDIILNYLHKNPNVGTTIQS